MAVRKTIVRIIVYASLAIAVIITIVSFGWYRWQGYTCLLDQDGIAVYTDYDTLTARNIQRLCLSFRDYFDQTILPVSRGDLKIYFFKDQKQYYAYCRRIRAINSPHGFYSRRHRLIVINGPMSGYGTIFHEMVHHLIHQGNYKLPLWLEEGLAAYHERGMGYIGHSGENMMLFGYLHPVKYQDLQAESFTRELTFADMEQNQHTASTFFVFADRHRAINKFLQAYLNTHNLETACCQAFGCGADSVQKLWTAWLRSQVLGRDFEFWQRCQFFVSRDDFQNYLDYYGARWDDEYEIYTAN